MRLTVIKKNFKQLKNKDMNSLNSTGNFWMDKGLAAMISLAFVLGSIMLGTYFS